MVIVLIYGSNTVWPRCNARTRLAEIKWRHRRGSLFRTSPPPETPNSRGGPVEERRLDAGARFNTFSNHSKNDHKIPPENHHKLLVKKLH